MSARFDSTRIAEAILRNDRKADKTYILRACNTHDALTEACAKAYVLLADISHEWHGRSTLAGQALLCDLRDALATATERDAQEVQDAASISTLLFKSEQS